LQRRANPREAQKRGATDDTDEEKKKSLTPRRKAAKEEKAESAIRKAGRQEKNVGMVGVLFLPPFLPSCLPYSGSLPWRLGVFA
jgi:hypothetical protein